MTEINTKEALAALPPGTVLRERGGDIGEWDGTVLAGTDGGWWNLDYVVAAFPLTVLYRPDQPDRPSRVAAALALQAEHANALHGETECVCLGCQMGRVLRGEETR
jgi:hypothetical protein